MDTPNMNYAGAYSALVDEQFSQEALTTTAVNNDYKFDGVNRVTVYSVPTVPLNDYDMEAERDRYGAPVELGNEVQELKLSQDKAFTFTVDRRNNTDTQMAMSAGTALARQLREVIAPTVDRYRLAKLVEAALPENTKTEEITDKTAYAAFLDGSMTLFDAHVPSHGRVAFVSPAFYKAIKLDKNFTAMGDKAQELAVNGVVGVIDKTSIIVTPTDYLPEGVNFIITHPSAMTSPVKIAKYLQHEDPQGINGWVVEGRIYYDAFVLNNKKSAIYVSIKKAAGAG